MSKGLGQKIGIKFTEDLVGDVSGNGTATPYSFYRWYITSTWSSSGRLYLYELEFFSGGIKVNTNKIISMTGSSRYSSSYDVNRLFDGAVPGTEWDADGSLPHWVSIELDEAIVIDSFRWHTGTSGNKPKEFILQGSDDGTNWVDIYTDESPNLNNWIDFDVVAVGNEIAFTVTGKEYKYVNGPLIDRNYRVEKVERYPIQRVWGIDESIILEGEGWQEPFNDMNSWDIQYGGNKWSIVNFEGENVLRHYSTAQTRDVLIATNLGVLMDADIYCDVYITGTGTSGKRPSIATRIGGTVGSETCYTFPARARDNKIQIGKYVSGTFTELAYSSFNYKTNTWYTIRASTEGNNLKFKIWERGQVEPSSWNLETIDNSISSGYVGLFDFDGNGNSYFDNFELKGEYLTPKIYTTEAIELSGEVRIRWDEDKPANTNILVEYTTGETQGQWQTVSNGDIITSDTNLWIRATLSTEDTSVTPVLQDLWLEEPDAPQDTILLTMDPLKRFNNVEGELTVKYDASKGSLSGRGGPVESFTETFLPIDLEPKPNPHVVEAIISIPSINTAFTKVTYNSRHASDCVVAKNPSIAVIFTKVDDINP